MRKSGNQDNVQLMEHQLRILAGVLLGAESESEMLSLLNTILTPSEKAAISQRVAISKKLHDGRKYYEIEGMYGVSPSTITKALDLYLKHGDDNATFNQIMGKYKEPKFSYKSSRKKVVKMRGWADAHIPGAIRLDEI